MRASKLIIGAIFLILCMVGAVSAQESGTSQENACNEGGILFRDGVSLCETEWHWECGWYIANWQNTGALVPDWCGTGYLSHYFPYIGCVLAENMFVSHVWFYLYFGYSRALPKGALVYNNAVCDPSSIATGYSSQEPMVYAYSDAEAVAGCAAAFGLHTAQLQGQSGNGAIYRCYP